MESEDHWRLVNENRGLIEGIILDQIRLMKRHQRVPLWFGDQNVMIWIRLESGGEYGLLGFDTELIVEQAGEAAVVDENEFQMTLIPGLKDGFYWRKAGGLYRIGEDAVVNVHSDPQIPEGFLQISYYILDHLLQLTSKSKINCKKVAKKKLEYPHQWILSSKEAKPVIVSFQFESVVFVEAGAAMIGSAVPRKNIIYQKIPAPPLMNELVTFLLNEQKLLLIEGEAGVGKTAQIQQAIHALNWSYDFVLPIKYYDLQTETPILANNSSKCLYILDHFDEYFEGEGEEAQELDKFRNIVKQINHSTQTLGQSIALIVRSSRNLIKYMRSCGWLSFDAKFTIEKSCNASLIVTDSPAFDHVLGTHSALRQLKRLLFHPIKYEHIYAANGMRTQGGVLIHGPSGCGKTFISESFLKAHGIPFIRVRGPELLDKYVGASEAAVRDVFARARKQRPCVLFFDEFDSLVPQRGSNHSGVTDRIVNQFLTELDGTGDRSGVYVLATSSRPELIDKAILRPGRVDARIELTFPGHEELREV